MFDPSQNTDKHTQGQKDEYYIPSYPYSTPDDVSNVYGSGSGVPPVYNPQAYVPPTEYDPTAGTSELTPAVYDPSEPMESPSKAIREEGVQDGYKSHLTDLDPSDIFSLSDPDFARLGPKSTIPIPSGDSLNTGSHELPPGFIKQTHEPDSRSYDSSQMAEYISSEDNVSQSYISIEENLVTVPSTAPNPSKGSELEVPLNLACDATYVDELMETKKMFDNIPTHLFTSARYRSNPYEAVRSSELFQRNAIKMANIDAVTGVSTQIELLPEEREVLYYCDLNGEKGGFVEYICWRYKECGSRGWGMTPKSNITYELNKFSPAAPHSSFTEVYGSDDTGDLTIEDNRNYLNSIINANTENRGVALCLADGTVTVPKQENRQEVLARTMLLSECLTALTVLRKGGNLVCKVYDIFTTFTLSLLYVLYQEFEEIALFKPLASRPASSEKYIICKRLRQRNPPVTIALTEALRKLIQGVNVISLVDQNKIRNDTVFFEYFKRKNAEFAKEQLYFLDRIRKCVEDPRLELNEIQRELANECAIRWGVPKPSQRQIRPRGRGRGRGSNRGRGGYHGSGQGGHQSNYYSQSNYYNPQSNPYPNAPSIPHSYSSSYGSYRGRGGHYRQPHMQANISGVRGYGEMSSVDTPVTPFAQTTKSWTSVRQTQGLSKQEQIEMMRNRHSR